MKAAAMRSKRRVPGEELSGEVDMGFVGILP